WVSSRKGLLSATFLLLSLICWLRKERTARDEGYGLLFLLLALLAKAIAAVVPAVVLSYDVWIRRKPLAESVARQFVPGLLAVMFLLLTVSSQTTMYGGVRGHMSLGTFHILAIDAVILWKYAGSLVWPSALCVLYDPPPDGIAWAVAMAVAGWAVVVTAVYRLRRRWPYLRWALLTAFLFLVPVLNLVPITTLMNDRYLYLPCVPLFALFAAGTLRVSQLLANVLGRGVSHGMSTACARGFAGVLVAAALGASAMCTRNYLPVWRNGLTLWTHAERHLPDLPAVNYQLADAHYRAGRKRRAVSLLEHALAQGNADDGDRIRFAKTLSQWRNRDAER
ncbi:MAG: hypothetical protein ACE5KM_16145, partial [Planctomycetaceae bacterium]